MTLIMDVLPQEVGKWAELITEKTYRWQPATTERAAQWAPNASELGQARLILLAKQLTKQAVLDSLAVCDEAQLTVSLTNIKRVAQRDVLSFSVSDWRPELKAHLQTIAREWDFAYVPALPEGREPGLVLMDMDSTAIQIECIDEMARLAGVGDEVAAVTQAAMEGALPFSESLRRRVKALAGADVAIIDQVLAEMPLMPGLVTLVTGLKAMGWKVALASGGFTPFTGHLHELLALDAHFSNTLAIENDRFTGEVLGEIVDAEAKARILEELAVQYQIPLSQTVAIGDGANDLLMLAKAGLGVALHAKPLVQEQAPVCFNQLSLEGVLGLLQAS